MQLLLLALAPRYAFFVFRQSKQGQVDVPELAKMLEASQLPIRVLVLFVEPV
jgi:hypothetical protein